MAEQVPGTRGYTEAAEKLVREFERIPFLELHSDVIYLLPQPPADILDIGAGSGRDAAYLTVIGHRVVAVEPTAALRDAAARLHPMPEITWIDDALPDLPMLAGRKGGFDVAMLTAVWMHLEPDERARAMPVIAGLLRDRGLAIMLLRHGPLPEARHMFPVDADETCELAQTCGLRPILHQRRDSVQAGNREAGVTWTRLAFEKRG